MYQTSYNPEMQKIKDHVEKLTTKEIITLLDPGTRGRYSYVPIKELKVDLQLDGGYQRDPSPELTRRFEKIAREFRYMKLGSLSVMQRTNGDKYIVDGQQRWRAALMRGDIKELPCMIHPSTGRSSEAIIFYALNVFRSSVAAVSKFIAAERAGMQPQREIAGWLKTIGLTVMGNGKAPHGVCFPFNLQKKWQQDSDLAKEAMLMQMEINDGDSLCGDVFLGLYYLLREEQPIRGEAQKLKKMGGKTLLIKSMKQVKIEAGVESNRTRAQGILRLINKGRKIKLRLSADDEA